jgi:hypothetical protein
MTRRMFALTAPCANRLLLAADPVRNLVQRARKAASGHPPVWCGRWPRTTTPDLEGERLAGKVRLAGDQAPLFLCGVIRS